MKVQVEVLEARDLLAVDRSGKSDPYVTIEIREKHEILTQYKPVKTRVIPKCLCPEWDDASFEFEDVPVTAKFHFEVLDHNGMLMRAKPLGHADLGIDEDSTCWDSTGGWLKLSGSKTGELRIKVAIVEDNGTNAVKAGAHEIESWQFNAFPLLKSAHESPHIKPNVLLVAVLACRNLKAMDKALIYGQSSSDPFVKLRFNTDAKSIARTKVIQKELNPIFCEQFHLPLPVCRSRLTDQESGRRRSVGAENSSREDSPLEGLVLEVQVDDANLVASTLIGSTQIPVIKLLSNASLSDDSTQATWYGLRDPKSTSENPRECGEIKLALKLDYDPQLDPAEKTRQFFFEEKQDDNENKKIPNEIRIAVCRARDLIASDLPRFSGTGSSDPFVVLTLQGSSLTQRTRTKKKTLQPVFDETFSFEIDGAAIRQEQKNAPRFLKCEVFDQDLMDADDPLGHATLNLCELVRAVPGQVVRKWYPLKQSLEQNTNGKSRGEILIAAQCVYNTDLVWSDPLGSDPLDAEAVPNEIRVALFKVRGLTFSAAAALASDVVVDFQLLAGAHRDEWTSSPKPMQRAALGSNGQTNNLYIWRQTFVRPLDPPADYDSHNPEKSATVPYQLELVVNAANATALGGRKTPAGNCKLPLDSLLGDRSRSKEISGWFPLRSCGEDNARSEARALRKQLKGQAIKDKYLGEVFVTIVWQYNPVLDFLPYKTETDGDALANMPNELCVALIQGRDLRPSNTAIEWHVTPFIEFETRDSSNLSLPEGTVQRSSTASTAIKPVWRECFSIPLKPEKDSNWLHLSCFDEAHSRQFVGANDIDISTLLDRRLHRDWYALYGRTPSSVPGESVLGPRIELILCWRYNAELDPKGTEIESEAKESLHVENICQTEEDMASELESESESDCDSEATPPPIECPVQLRAHNDELYTAAAEGKCEVIRSFVRIQLRRFSGYTAKKLIEERSSKCGRSLLHEAALAGQDTVLKLLIEEFDANLDARGLLGRETPLHLAVVNSHRHTVFLLIQYGANPDLPNKIGMRPLHYATKLSVARLLLRHGARVNARDSFGRTPLDCARKSNVSEDYIDELARAVAIQDRKLHNRAIAAEREKVRKYDETIGARLEAQIRKETDKTNQRIQNEYIAWRKGEITGNQAIELRKKREQSILIKSKQEVRFQALAQRSITSSSMSQTSSADTKSARSNGMEMIEAAKNKRANHNKDMCKGMTALTTLTFASQTSAGAMPTSTNAGIQWKRRDREKSLSYGAGSAAKANFLSDTAELSTIGDSSHTNNSSDGSAIVSTASTPSS